MLSWRASGESRIPSNTGSQIHGLGQPEHIGHLPTSSHFTSRCPSLQRSNRSRIRPFATDQPEKQAFGTEQPQLIFRHPNVHDETRRINSVEEELQQTSLPFSKMISLLLAGVRLQKELKWAMIFPSGLRAGPV
jgi:hypothetical protein